MLSMYSYLMMESHVSHLFCAANNCMKNKPRKCKSTCISNRWSLGKAGKPSNSTEFSTDDYLTRTKNGELLGHRMAVFAAWIAFPVWTVRVTFASLLGRSMMTTFCSKELKMTWQLPPAKKGVQWWALCKGEAGKMVEFCPYFYTGLMSWFDFPDAMLPSTSGKWIA